MANQHEVFTKLSTLLMNKGLEFPQTAQFAYWHDPEIKAIFSLLVEHEEFAEFTTKALWTLQRQNDELWDAVEKLESRISRLEPQEPDEMIVKLADGRLGLYLNRDENGNYVPVRSGDDQPAD